MTFASPQLLNELGTAYELLFREKKTTSTHFTQVSSSRKSSKRKRKGRKGKARKNVPLCNNLLRSMQKLPLKRRRKKMFMHGKMGSVSIVARRVIERGITATTWPTSNPPKIISNHLWFMKLMWVDGHTETWCVDTGSTVHICNCLHMFQATRSPTNEGLELKVGSGKQMKVEAIGTTMLRLTGGCGIVLWNYYYVPSFIQNRIFVSKLFREGAHLILDKTLR